MTTATQIFSTIITITYTKYTENIKVAAKNAQQLRDLINSDSDVQSWEVATQGDFEFQLIEPTEKTVEVMCCKYFRDGTQNGKPSISRVIVRKDGKIKFDGDDFGGDWSFRFQKVKETGRGQYIHIYGTERLYFEWDAPTFN